MNRVVTEKSERGLKVKVKVHPVTGPEDPRGGVDV
jgi:hypothetical protein